MDNTKEHPVVLTVQEVNAVLAGDKTQHRAPIEKSDNTAILFDGRDWRYDGKEFIEDACCDPNPRGKHYFEQIKRIGNRTEFLEDYRSIGHCPLGKVGDRLWVQEFHASLPYNCRFTKPHYYADGSLTLDTRHDAGLLTKYAAVNMPRWASRILLEITDIRIERLNDISEQDAIATGIKHIHADPKDRVNPNHFTKSNGWYHCSRPAAAEVFKEMYTVSDGYDKYGENPWVWVVEFKVVEPSEVTK